MEGHCSTGQSPQWAVVSMEEILFKIPIDWLNSNDYKILELINYCLQYCSVE